MYISLRNVNSLLTTLIVKSGKRRRFGGTNDEPYLETKQKYFLNIIFQFNFYCSKSVISKLF